MNAQHFHFRNVVIVFKVQQRLIVIIQIVTEHSIKCVVSKRMPDSNTQNNFVPFVIYITAQKTVGSILCILVIPCFKSSQFLFLPENLNYPQFVGCFICYESLGDHHPVSDSLYTRCSLLSAHLNSNMMQVTTVPSCCGQWFHQQCLRRYAINAGYAFMCPTCRSKTYGDFARRHGIYVPEQ